MFAWLTINDLSKLPFVYVLTSKSFFGYEGMWDLIVMFIVLFCPWEGSYNH